VRPAAPAFLPAEPDSSGAAAPRDLDGWPQPARFPIEQLVEPVPVVVRAADSTPIHLQVFAPADTPSAGGAVRRPAVLFFHGGPARQMLLGWNYSSYYHNSYAFNQYLASRGFVVVSVNYRGGIGYGRAFREAPRRGRFGASEYADVLAAAQYLRGRPDVDSARIGLWGGSYGGYLTALGLARNSDLFAAGVDLHGVHDYAEEVGMTSQWGVSDSAIAVARRSSPVADIERWRSPVLLIHGDDDRNVEFQQTTDLARRLELRGVAFEELVLPDEVHSFLRHASWLTVYRAGTEFFLVTLRGRR
jgi:dipeptidyl aminopeptidase/acylaminoacyl peptidase